MRQNATQLFYFVNRFHDWLAQSPIGFTEAAGNFQVTNSSGQGEGGDAVQAQALDGANTAGGFPDGDHFNTASMDTARRRRAAADADVPDDAAWARTAATSTAATTPRSSTTSTRTGCRRGW